MFSTQETQIEQLAWGETCLWKFFDIPDCQPRFYYVEKSGAYDQ